MTLREVAREIVGNTFSGDHTLSGFIKNRIVEELVIYKVARYIGLKNPLPFIGAKLVSRLICHYATPSFIDELPRFLSNPATNLTHCFLSYKASVRTGLDRLNFISLVGIATISQPVSSILNSLMNAAVLRLIPRY